MAVDESRFIVDSKTRNYEIRTYKSVIVAEVKINHTFKEAFARASRILLDYIHGNNQSNSKIQMTFPSTQQKTEDEKPSKIVHSNRDYNIYLVQFTMPKEHKDVEGLPEPRDERVNIRKIPERKLVAFSFTGSWSVNRYLKMLKFFKEQLKQNGVEVSGNPIFARYNTKYRFWFIRENEIWFQLRDNVKEHADGNQHT